MAPYSQDVCWSSLSSADCHPECSLPVRTFSVLHLLSVFRAIAPNYTTLKAVRSVSVSGLNYCACGFWLLW